MFWNDDQDYDDGKHAWSNKQAYAFGPSAQGTLRTAEVKERVESFTCIEEEC